MLGKSAEFRAKNAVIVEELLAKIVPGFRQVFEKSVVVLNARVATGEYAVEGIELSDPAADRIAGEHFTKQTGQFAVKRRQAGDQ